LPIRSVQTVPELFIRAAGLDCHIVADDGRCAVADLEARSRSLAAGLRSLGVGHGDRVAAWLPNIPDYLTLYVAIARLGAILVAVNTRFGAAEIADIIGRSGAKALAVAAEVRGVDQMPVLRQIEAAALPELRHVIFCGTEGNAKSPWPGTAAIGLGELATAAPMDAFAGRPDDLVNIFTTSGTTSAPKFAAHRQRGVVGHNEDIAKALDFGASGTVSLQLLPFCGVFGFCQVMSALAGGSEIVMPGAIDVGEAVSLLHRHRATHLFTTDDLLHRMLETADGGAPFAELRYCMFGGFNTWLHDLPARAEARGVPMIAPFGMSEVFAIFAGRRLGDSIDDRHRAGGQLVNPQSRVRARDPETGVLLAHGEAGELEVWGPHMFAEYFGDAEATRRAMTEDGYLRTGDLGYSETDTRFTYLQRMNDTLRLGGFLVAPAEIETAVMAHPAVKDAQVVAIGTSAGNRPVAFVIPSSAEEFDEAGVIAACGAHLPKFKTPVRVISLPEFPVTRSANGTKIQRAKLRQMAQKAVSTSS